MPQCTSSAAAISEDQKADFDGCSTNLDEGKRRLCCDSVELDCKSRCSTDHFDDPGSAWLLCRFSCSDASDSCNEGEKAKREVDWPGQVIPIPGLFYDENRIASDDNTSIILSPETVVFEIQEIRESPGQSTCMAVVTSCECPQVFLENKGKMCEPTVASGSIQCNVCTIGKDSKVCKFCRECNPLVGSVGRCAKDLQRNMGDIYEYRSSQTGSKNSSPQ